MDRNNGARGGRPTPQEVADELVRCRRRGLGRLDSRVGSEPGLELPAVGSLCAVHFGRAAPRDRGVAIGALIRTTAEHLGHDRPDDARLVVELFFGDTAANVPDLGPGELLDAASRRRSPMSEAVFRRLRRDTFLRFARAMIDHVAHDTEPAATLPGGSATGRAETIVRTSAATVAALAADPEVSTAELLDRLREMASEYEISEVLDVIVRFDTPDILG